MVKKFWRTCAFTGVFGLSVAGAGVAYNARADRPVDMGPSPATVAPRGQNQDTSTDVSRLLRTCGIVRLPPVRPGDGATVPAQPANVAPVAASRLVDANKTAAAVASDLTQESDARLQVQRLPRPEQPAADVIEPVEQKNPEIIRTEHFEPSEPAPRSTQTGVRDASTLGWDSSSLRFYELGANARRRENEPPLPRPAVEREAARPERTADAARREDLRRDEIAQEPSARREAPRTAAQTAAQPVSQRRNADDDLYVSRTVPRRQETSSRQAEVDRDYDDYDRPEVAARVASERSRPAPLPQRYSASYAAERADERAPQRDQPRSGTVRTSATSAGADEPAPLHEAMPRRSLRPDDVADAVTSRRELLMVDEERFNAAARQNQYQPQQAPHAALARYRMEEQAASPAYQGAESIVYPPGGPNLVYGPGGCNDCNGCGSCNSCGPVCDGWLWVFGTETTMLFADRDGVDAQVRIATPATRFDATADDELGIGPRIWFGARSCRWEVLGRFWALGDIGDDADPLAIGTPDAQSIYSGSDVEAYTADVELIRHFCCGPCWDIYCGVGFRYASLEQTARVTGTATDGALPPGFVYADAIAYNQISGPGITAVFGGSRLLHCYCCSSLNAFWNVRGSMIWGDTQSAAQTTLLATDPNGILPAFAGRIDAAFADTQGDLYVGELQVGLRWCHPLQCLPAVASVHVAFETQLWDADGGFAFAEGIAQANNNIGFAQASSGPNAEVSLIGLNIGCGLTW